MQIWFDGGYSSSQQEKIESLLEETQPQAVIFNGCDTDGNCLSANSSECTVCHTSDSYLRPLVRWIGTEEGQAPEENWST